MTKVINIAEYVLLDEEAKDIQHKLNLWRHSYAIVLHGMTFYTEIEKHQGTKMRMGSVMVERIRLKDLG
jgi:hypothetical protein